MEASPIRRTGWNRSIRSAAVGTGMHTQHLSFFIAAAEELNVHRAAARLGVSEQALARNLRSLELELDVALFRRLPRGLRLTEAGEALLAHARTIENHMHLVIEQARNHAQGRPERLEVGAYGAVLLTHIPAVLQTFRALYPAVDIVLHNLPKDQMIKGLRQGRLHACFDRMVPTLPDLQRECVMRERIVVALNRKNPLAAKREVHFLDLRDEPMIVGDLPNVTVYGQRGGPQTVDDIRITAEIGQIDGLYGILGQAGPTSVRTSGSLPATAQMQFDVADVDWMGAATFAQVVLHEMSHSLGFGSIWDRLGLVTNGQFTGANAVHEYDLMVNGTPSGIPVEQDGGAGTAGSHWDEETFNNELMTGYINDGPNYFTAMSEASFRDLGYQINSNYASLADPGYVFG